MNSIDYTEIVKQVFAGSTALAGLVLVFLGGVLTAYETYDAEQKSTIRGRFKRRAWIAFSGFVAALTSASLSLLFHWNPASWVFCGCILSLSVSFAILLVMGFLSLQDLNE